ncbi:hypothetical protein RIF29_15562 [Crotalaria pallida]|uniref:Hexosyltransferase n=1 Tax=Crotalaria pallida TaxID=3830 RepID=A0AAN9FHF1_CROPI
MFSNEDVTIGAWMLAMNVNHENNKELCAPDWLNPGQAVETTKLEYGRGRGNFRWSGEMRRDRKEHQRRIALGNLKIA